MKKFVLILQLLIAFQFLSATQKEVNCTTAGQLESYFLELTPSEKSDISKLTVTGEINAKDIYYINTSMSTDTLILTNVDIKEYIGSQGDGFSSYVSEISGLTFRQYPANEFPEKGLQNNQHIRKITLPNSLTSIGANAFENSVIDGTIWMPNSMIKIGNSAFAGCSKISSVVLTRTKEIGDNAFAFCTWLDMDVLPTYVEKIGVYAFAYCSNLRTPEFPAGTQLKTIGERAFSGCTKITDKLTLPGEVQYGDGIFNGCTNLTAAELGAGMDTIPYEFFKGCNKLSNVTLPSSIKVINTSAFEACSLLSTINLQNGLEKIEQNAFASCTALDLVSIPSTLKFIGDYAFSDCSSVTNLTLPTTLTNLGIGSFLRCNALTSVIVSTSEINAISASAFQNCTSLKSIHLPASINSINNLAFSGCVNVDSIFSRNSLPPYIYTNGLQGLSTTNCKIYTPSGYMSKYMIANGWKDFEILTEDITDKTRPVKLSSFPVDGQQNISVRPGFRFKFNEKVIATNGCEIKVVGDGETFTYDKNSRIETEDSTVYIESDILNHGKDYTLTIKKESFRDASGNRYPVDDEVITFKTVMSLKKTITLNFNKAVKFYTADSAPVDSLTFANSMEDLGYKFLGSCTVGGNQSYNIRGQYNYKERGFPIKIESNYTECRFGSPNGYERTQKIESDTAILLGNANYNGLTEQAHSRIIIDLNQIPATTPITDIYAKIRMTGNYDQYTQKPLVVSIYSGGVEKYRVNLYNTTHTYKGYYESAFIHLPLVDDGKIDSIVFNKNEDVFAEIGQVRIDYSDDTKAPELISSYPAAGKTGVSQTPGIRLQFSEKVNLKNNSSYFVKIIEQGQSTPTISYDYSARVKTDSTMVYFEPKLDTYFDSNPDTLKTNTQYKLVIPAGMIIDNNGNEFNSSDYEVSFTTGSKNVFHTLFYPAGDIKYMGGKFLGGTSGVACGSVSNGYHIQTSNFKREIMENDVKINLFTKTNLCYYTLIETVPTYSGSKYFLAFDEVYDGNWNLEKADEKATFELSKFKEGNNPISDLILKIKYNRKGLNIKTFSNGIVNNSIVVDETSHDGLNYRYLHVPVLNNAQIDSMVVSGIGTTIYAIFIQYKQDAKPVVNLGQNRGFCSKDGTTLDAGFSAGASYLWNTGAKTQTIEVHTSGLYSVAVTNSKGTTNAQVTLTANNKPIAIYNKQTIVKCAGDNVTLTANDNASFTYQWSASHSPLFHSNERSLQVTVPGIYSVKISNGGCDIVDTVYVEDRQGARVAFMNQSCCFGHSDLRGELYAKNQQGNFSLFKVAAAQGGGSVFDSIPAGDYIYKSHVNQLTMLIDNNPWVDTYHNGKTDWNTVTAFKLNCLTDTTIAFEMAKMKMDFEFNGTGVISGTIQVINGQSNAPYNKIKAQINDACDTKIMLYDGSGNLIASTCPDGNGNYSFTNLPVGNYTVGIERTGFEVESVFTTTVEEGETVINVDFTVIEGEQTVVPGIVSGIKPVSTSGLSGIRLSPNPAQSYSNLEFELKQTGAVSITITDLSGRIVKMQNYQLIAGKNKVQLDILQLSGMYLVKIATVAGTEITRLIVQ